MTAKNKSEPARVISREHYNVDFSQYSHRHYPLEKCHENKTLLVKALNAISFLASSKMPTALQTEGYCKTLERLNPRQDKTFLGYFDLPQCMFYYLSFGKNKMGIAIAIDSSTKTVFFLAIDNTHGIRPWHGKLG